MYLDFMSPYTVSMTRDFPTSVYVSNMMLYYVIQSRHNGEYDARHDDAHDDDGAQHQDVSIGHRDSHDIFHY